MQKNIKDGTLEHWDVSFLQDGSNVMQNQNVKDALI